MADGPCSAFGFVATVDHCVDCGRTAAGRTIAPDVAAPARAWWQPSLSAADRVRLEEKTRSLHAAFLCCDCMVDVVRAEARARWWDALAAALAVPLVFAIFASPLLRIATTVVAVVFLSLALSAWSTRRAPVRRPKRVLELLRRHVRSIQLERR